MTARKRRLDARQLPYPMLGFLLPTRSRHLQSWPYTDPVQAARRLESVASGNLGRLSLNRFPGNELDPQRQPERNQSI